MKRKKPPLNALSSLVGWVLTVFLVVLSVDHAAVFLRSGVLDSDRVRDGLMQSSITTVIEIDLIDPCYDDPGSVALSSQELRHCLIQTMPEITMPVPALFITTRANAYLHAHGYDDEVRQVALNLVERAKYNLQAESNTLLHDGLEQIANAMSESWVNMMFGTGKQQTADQGQRPILDALNRVEHSLMHGTPDVAVSEQ